MKLNIGLLLATLLLVAVCAMAIVNPKTTIVADGGGGAPVPPCPANVCPPGR